MANCINTSSKEYIELLEQSKLNPLILKARISIFQDKNGLDSYPKLEDVIQSKVVESNLLESLKGSKKNELDWNENVSENIIQEAVDFILDTDYSAEHNRILFNNKQGKVTVDEILENILNNFNDLTPKGRELIEKSRRLVGRTGAKFQFVSDEQLQSKDTLMQIDGNTNTIQISRNRIKKVNPKEVVESFIHELAHAQTLQALINPQTFEEKEFQSLINKYYFDFVSKTGSVESYGFKNTKEFVAEIYANPEFRKELRSIDLKNKNNYWKQFLDALRRLFGMTKNQETNNLIESVVDFVESDRRDYQGYRSQKQLIFEKQTNVPNKTKIETVEDRVNRTLDKAKDNLDNLLKLSKKYKKQNEAKGAKFEAHIQELIEEINKVDGLNQWKGVAVYVKSMLSTIKQLDERLTKEDLSAENGLEIIDLYRTYLSSYDLVDDVKTLISSLQKDKVDEIGEDVVKEIKDTITEAIGRHSVLESDFNAKLADILKNQLNTLNYLPQVEDKWRKKLAIEYKQRGLTNIGQDEWISKQMNGPRQEEIQIDLDDAISELLTGIGTDISWAGQMFGDMINNNSRLVSITTNLITQAREKIIEQTRNGDIKESKLFEELIKEKGTSKPSELYKNILDVDSTGHAVFKGEYSIKFKEEYLKFKRAKEEAFNKIKESKDFKNSEYVKAKNDFAKFKKENTVVVDDIRIPIAKWKNDLSKLSKTEKETLNYFIKTTKNTDKQTNGIQSLINEFVGAIYYELPAVTKSNEERIIEGELKGIVKDKIKDLTEIRPDDVGYQEQRLDSKGNSIHYLKVHYRGNLTPDQQSLDLFTINRLNRINGINYQEKESIALQVEAIKMIAKNKEYYIKTKGGESVLNKYAERVKEATKTDGQSNESKMIENIIEKNLYDILHIQYDKLGPLDVNKVISTANGWVSSVGLSLNAFSAAANILNAQAQIFLEKVAGNHLSKGSVEKAHKIYGKDLANIAGDYSRPIKQSFVNQVNQMFDTFGGFTVKQQDYIKNTITKTAVNFESLQFLHEGGEHYVQSIMVMATLESIKVMNDNNDYIDKDGKVVEKDKSVSVLDMLSKDDNGVVQLSDKVVYTNRSFNTKLKEGGKEQLMLFVKKKLFDTMGNYDSNMQPEAYRHWWGKMILLFRRYLIPQAVARFRGLTKALVHEDDLTEDDIHFNNALRTTEEGSYVSTIRFIRHTIYPALKQLKFDIISTNWNELSKDKKAGIKKSVMELALTGAILPLVGMLAAGAAGDDDDKKWLWTVAFLARRLESELSQFRDPREATKITKSPIPSLRIIEQTLDVVEYILPWNWSEINDRYETGKNKGKLKIKRKIEKLTPVLSRIDVTAEELYNAQNSRWGK